LRKSAEKWGHHPFILISFYILRCMLVPLSQNKQKEGIKMRKIIKPTDLVPGMVLKRCVTDLNGKIVLSEGAVMTEKTIQRLLAWDISEVCIDCPADENTARE
jgi:hypothetical protein